MADTESTNSPGAQGEALFATTRWSIVLAARDNQAPESAQALETLCRTYWYPLYALVRGLGHSPQDAQDLAQEFFARLLAKDYLRVVSPERGRFRTFLRMALKRFLANEWDRVHAQKRGGGQALLTFDTNVAETRFQGERSVGITPDHLYDRQWALTLLDETLARVQAECAASGRLAEWQHFEPYLTAERGTIPYDQLAAALQSTPGAVRVALYRFRKRFREAFREAIANTVSEPAEIDGELRYVIEVLGRE